MSGTRQARKSFTWRGYVEKVAEAAEAAEAGEGEEKEVAARMLRVRLSRHPS
jgi:hypothetical protein